jgi:hypothetical protein
MNDNKIINLAEPTARKDAATAGYVANFTSHLNNVKLTKAGDTMTGNLDMDQNKITNVSSPTDETDVVNKQYVDSLVERKHDVSIHALGRYIIIPDEDGIKTYFSVRARKNVDLDSDKLVEVKNGNLFNADPTKLESLIALRFYSTQVKI